MSQSVAAYEFPLFDNIGAVPCASSDQASAAFTTGSSFYDGAYLKVRAMLTWDEDGGGLYPEQPISITFCPDCTDEQNQDNPWRTRTIDLGFNNPYSAYPFFTQVTLTRDIQVADQEDTMGDLDYPVLDRFQTYMHVVSGVNGIRFTALDFTIFFTKTMMWLEGRGGPSDLATSFVSPLYFGIGTQLDGVDFDDLLIKVDTFWGNEFDVSPPVQCQAVTWGQFRFSDLHNDVNANYSYMHNLPNTNRIPVLSGYTAEYPFLNNGASAAAIYSIFATLPN